MGQTPGLVYYADVGYRVARLLLSDITYYALTVTNHPLHNWLLITIRVTAFPTLTPGVAHTPVRYYADVVYRQKTSACVRCYADVVPSDIPKLHEFYKYYANSWRMCAD